MCMIAPAVECGMVEICISPDQFFRVVNLGIFGLIRQFRLPMELRGGRVYVLGQDG